MGIEIPGWLRGVASVAVGDDWPDGDETAMRRCADAWKLMSVDIGGAQTLGANATTAALSAIDGDVNEAIARHWQLVDSAGLDKLRELCDHLEETLEEGAADIEKAKITILSALAILAAQLVADAATVLAAGAGAFAAAAETAATRVAVRMIVRELIEKLLSRAVLSSAARTAALQAIEGAATTLGTDVGVQAGQVLIGHRNKIDTSNFGNDIAGGAAEGAASGALGKEGLGQVVGDGGSKLSKVLSNAAVDGAAGMAGSVAEKEATGEDIDWKTLTSGGIGGFHEGVQSYREGLEERTSDAGSSNDTEEDSIDIGKAPTKTSTDITVDQPDLEI